MYEYKDPNEKPKKNRPSTTQIGNNRPQTKADIPQNNDYADFYRRMKIMGKDKQWTEERL